MATDTVIIPLDRYNSLKKLEENWNEKSAGFTTVYLTRDRAYFLGAVIKTKDEAIIEVDKKWRESFDDLQKELERVKKQSIWSFIKHKVFGNY